MRRTPHARSRDCRYAQVTSATAPQRESTYGRHQYFPFSFEPAARRAHAGSAVAPAHQRLSRIMYQLANDGYPVDRTRLFIQSCTSMLPTAENMNLVRSATKLVRSVLDGADIKPLHDLIQRAEAWCSDVDDVLAAAGQAVLDEMGSVSRAARRAARRCAHDPSAVLRTGRRDHACRYSFGLAGVRRAQRAVHVAADAGERVAFDLGDTANGVVESGAGNAAHLVEYGLSGGGEHVIDVAAPGFGALDEVMERFDVGAVEHAAHELRRGAHEVHVAAQPLMGGSDC